MNFFLSILAFATVAEGVLEHWDSPAVLLGKLATIAGLVA